MTYHNSPINLTVALVLGYACRIAAIVAVEFDISKLPDGRKPIFQVEAFFVSWNLLAGRMWRSFKLAAFSGRGMSTRHSARLFCLTSKIVSTPMTRGISL